MCCASHFSLLWRKTGNEKIRGGSDQEFNMGNEKKKQVFDHIQQTMCGDAVNVKLRENSGHKLDCIFCRVIAQ